MRHSAVCRDCGWTRDYTRAGKAATGLARHLARQCRPAEVGTVGRPRQLTDARARDRVTAAGLPTQRSTDEWLAHPYALDDLFRVVCGTRISTISRERAVLRALEGGAA